MIRKWETIEYAKPSLDFDSLQIQGEAILVSESYPLELLMKILFTSISLSREFVLEEKDQKLIIFSHLPKGVLRLEKVDDFFIKNNIYKNELTDNKIELQEINVEEYWLKYKNEKNYLKAIKKTFEEIKKEIKLSEKTIIIGPSLKPLVLLLEYYLYDKTNELWYSEDNKNIKIF